MDQTKTSISKLRTWPVNLEEFSSRINQYDGYFQNICNIPYSDSISMEVEILESQEYSFSQIIIIKEKADTQDYFTKIFQNMAKSKIKLIILYLPPLTVGTVNSEFIKDFHTRMEFCLNSVQIDLPLFLAGSKLYATLLLNLVQLNPTLNFAGILTFDPQFPKIPCHTSQQLLSKLWQFLRKTYEPELQQEDTSQESLNVENSEKINFDIFETIMDQLKTNNTIPIYMTDSNQNSQQDFYNLEQIKNFLKNTSTQLHKIYLKQFHNLSEDQSQTLIQDKSKQIVKWIKIQSLSKINFRNNKETALSLKPMVISLRVKKLFKQEKLFRYIGVLLLNMITMVFMNQFRPTLWDIYKMFQYHNVIRYITKYCQQIINI